MVGLALTVVLPTVLLQLYRVYVGPISLGLQLGVGFIVSVLAGLVLYFGYRSSARNQP